MIRLLNEKDVGVCGLICGNYPCIPLEQLRRSIKTYVMMTGVLAEF
jgi:hypothetical protein